MKKLFICALALASVVACSKDDVAQGVALDSKNKSIEITIENSGAATRAANDDITAGETLKGSKAPVAEAKTMDILFADASGTILKVMDLVAGTGVHENDPADNLDSYTPGASSTATGEDGISRTTYVWHNVPAAVTQVAIVRDVMGDVTITPGETKLATVKGAADDEVKNLTRSVDEIFLYGEDLVLESNGDCVTVNGIEYEYFLGKVRVAPLFARFEINSIQCTDLGDDNKDTDINSFGFDELTLTSLTWNSEDKSGYTIELPEAATMWGSYNSTTGTYGTNSNTDPATRTNYLTVEGVAPTATTKAWSWNILPTNFESMNLKFDGVAYDYALADDEVELDVTGLATTENASEANANAFAAENIYRIDIKFVENNLGGKAGLCVKVEVEIAEWTVNTVYPVFGTSGSSNAQ